MRGAPKGNKFATGNKGGGRPEGETRKKIATFKGLILDEAIKVLKGNQEDKKWQLILRAITAIMPREITGEDGGEIVLKIAKEISDKNETYKR